MEFGMTQEERRDFLLRSLLKERPEYAAISVPRDEQEQKHLLRSLFNLRRPGTVNEKFLRIQDEYLREELTKKGITDLADLQPVCGQLYLWQGDITLLRCDAIVNAANAQMLGCFCPEHGCIDNAIHTFSGVQLRLYCAEFMKRQGHEEEAGGAKITPAFNLPCRYILHTVGPVVHGKPSEADQMLLASCYTSCLELAEKCGLDSIAFCCISTGVFHFPGEQAAKIAVQTVTKWIEKKQSNMKVIFNVFRNRDYKIYKKLL